MSNSSDTKCVHHHPDAEASNALANIVADRLGFVSFTGRYGIAGDFLYWLDEHRPAWRLTPAEAAMKAEAWAEGYAAGHDCVGAANGCSRLPNPYRHV